MASLAGKGIKYVASSFGKTIVKAGKRLGEGVTMVAGKAAVDGIKTASHKVTEGVNFVASTAKGFADKIGSLWNKGATTVKTTFLQGNEKIQHAVKTLMDYKWIPGEGKGFAMAGVGKVSGGGQYSLKEAYQYMESKVVKGTGNNSSSKDVYGPYYDEAKKLHETTPDWYPNPDESTIVKGKELKEARADYQALVRRGELEKGHHVQGLSFGGENVSSNIKNTGESTIRREQIDDLNLDFYHEMGYGKENAKVLKIHENENGIIVFGNNPQHTEVTVFQNKVLKWQRENGKR